VGNFHYNISLGKSVEYAQRVISNDPTNSALIVMVLSQTGIESDATLKDKDDFAAILSGSTDEVTNSGYSRKTITDSTGGLTITVDDTNDRVDVDIADITWTGVAAGSNWSDIVIGYDSDTTSGTDANIVPMTQHDFVITPDGSDITAQVNVFLRAS
jgi:hypothetical protein